MTGETLNSKSSSSRVIERWEAANQQRYGFAGTERGFEDAIHRIRSYDKKVVRGAEGALGVVFKSLT